MITGSWIFIIAIFTALNHKTCHKTYKSSIPGLEFLITVSSISNEVLIIYEKYTERVFLAHHIAINY